MKKINLKSALLLTLSIVFNNLCFTQDYLWSITYGGTQLESPSDFTINSQGDIISVGYSLGGIDLDPSVSGVSNYTNNGSRDIFIQTLNENGDFLWAKSIGSTGQDVANKVAIDNSDNIYILGRFDGTVDFNPGGSNGTLTSNGGYDIYLLKLANNGDFLWVKQIGNSTNEFANSLKLDANNNVYLSGVFSGTIDFGMGGTSMLETSAGSDDAFVLKLDNDGNYGWVYAFGGTGQDYSGGILLNDAGDVYLFGGFANTVDFEYGAGTTSLTSAGFFFGLDSYLLKIDNSGSFVWVKNTGTSVGDVFAFHSEIDNMGNIYTTGSIEDITDFDPSINVYDASTSSPSNTATTYIQKLNSDGDLVWVKLNGNLDAYNLAFTSSNNILLVGEFSGTKDFDLGAGNFDMIPVNSTYALFFQTLNDNGDFVNAYFIDGYNNQVGRYSPKKVKYLSNGDLLVYGQFSGTIDLNVSPSIFETSTSAGSNDIFLLKQTNFDVSIKANTLNASIFPNPTTGLINIKTNNNNSNLSIYNIDGKLVYSNIISSNFVFELEQTPGIYFIEIESDNSIQKMKLIKL